MAETATTPAAPSAPAAPASPAPVTPAATPAAQPQPRAGSIPDAQWDGLPPAEQDRYARLKAGPDGGSIWVHRDQLAKEPADPAKPGSTAAVGDATVTADGRLQVGEMLLSQDDIKTLIAEKAQADLRKASIPTSAEAYTATLPQEFKLPPGVEYQFNETDPAYVAARTWAHSQNFTQQQFSQLLSFHANSQAAEQVLIGNAAKAELEKLGSMGTARVTAIDQWLRGTIGDASAQHIRKMMLTAGFVEGMEKIITKFTSQGAASFSQAHREPASAPGRVSEEAYAAMSQSERYAYAKGFDQKQFK
jgi:hypothetical protein